MNFVEHIVMSTNRATIVGYIIGMGIVLGLSGLRYYVCETTENETTEFVCWLTEE